MYVAYMAFPVGVVIIAFIYPLFEMIGFRRWFAEWGCRERPPTNGQCRHQKGTILM